jgi:serine/threonine-protein kinase
MTGQVEPRTGLRPGALVAGIYLVAEKVGEGASGEVWSATNTQNGIKVALKALFSSMIADEEVVARFRREAFFLARAKSDYVAKIYEFINDPVTGMVLVMEFIEGESLAQLFDRRILTVEESIDIGVDILSGVSDLHAARIIHRDLKPANILMQPQPGGRLRAVICDFSLSRLAKRRARDGSVATALTELTRGDVALGTVRYMAPEQVLNSRQATERSDLYAVGAILYRGLAGVHAFSEYQTIRQIARAKVTGESRPLETGRKDAVARGLEAIVAKTLRRKPAERYQEASEMRAALLHLVHPDTSADRDTQHMLAARAAESSGSSSISASSSPSSASSSSSGPSGRSSGGAPMTPVLPSDELRSVQVSFDSIAPKPRRPVALLAAGAIGIFAAGIFAGRIWGGTSTTAPTAAVASAAPSAAPADSALAAAALTPPRVASAEPAVPTAPAAMEASAGEAGVVLGEGGLAVADLEAPTVELPENPPAAEHHHHLAAAVDVDGASPAGSSSSNGPRGLPVEAGTALVASAAGKPEAGTGPGSTASKRTDEDDFENPYAPSPARAAPKAKPDGGAPGAAAPATGNGRATDASAALGF